MSGRLRNLTSALRSLFGVEQFGPLGQADVVFVSSDASRATLTPKGQRFDRYCDTLSLLLAEQGYSSIHLATPPSSPAREATFSPLHHVNKQFFLALLLDWLRVGSDGTLHTTRLARKILRETGARMVVGVEVFGAMRIAARQMGLPCVEILHAEGYVAPPRTFLTRSLLFPPGYAGRYKEVLPTHVVCFDDTSQQTISSGIPMGHLGIIRCSNFWTDQFALEAPARTKTSSFPWPPDYVRDSAQRPSHPVIVVTLAWGYGGEIPALAGKLKDGLLPNSLVETIGNLGSSFTWRVRLHQVQLTGPSKFYARQRQMLEEKLSLFTNVDIRSVQREPLPAIFLGATHHITLSSMACYEAARFGVPSLVLDKPADRKFDDLHAIGMVAFAADTASSLTQWVTSVPVSAAKARVSNSEARSIISSLKNLLNP